MIIGTDAMHRIRQVGVISLPGLSVYEVDEALFSFENPHNGKRVPWSFRLILSYCYEETRNDEGELVSFSLYPFQNTETIMLTEPIASDANRALDVGSITFAVLAQAELLDDVTITEHANLFATWEVHWTGKRGTIMQHEGQLYRALHDIGVGQNAPPASTPSLWQLIGNPADEWPQWVPFLGVGDAYRMGDRVTHNGKRWIVTAVGGDGIWNIWEPGVWGWTEVTD